MKMLTSTEVVTLQLTRLMHQQLVDDGHTPTEIKRVIDSLAYDITANSNKLEYFQTYYIQGYCTADLSEITIEQALAAREALSRMLWNLADEYL